MEGLPSAPDIYCRFQAVPSVSKFVESGSSPFFFFTHLLCRHWIEVELTMLVLRVSTVWFHDTCQVHRSKLSKNGWAGCFVLSERILGLYLNIFPKSLISASELFIVPARRTSPPTFRAPPPRVKLGNLAQPPADLPKGKPLSGPISLWHVNSQIYSGGST